MTNTGLRQRGKNRGGIKGGKGFGSVSATSSAGRPREKGKRKGGENSGGGAQDVF